jgi:hypothetical protein
MQVVDKWYNKPMKPISISLARKLGYLPTKSGSKYGNKKTEYGGRVYDSKKEAEYAKHLDMRMKARGKDKVIKWTPQVKYPMVVNGVKICDYYLDFLVEYEWGVEYIDIKPIDRKTGKSRSTDVFKLKKKLMLACHGIEILEQ